MKYLFLFLCTQSCPLHIFETYCAHFPSININFLIVPPRVPFTSKLEGEAAEDHRGLEV